MKNQSPVDFPGNVRVHIALAASNLEASRAFYETLLGEKPAKERPGYVKFEPRDPSVNLTLNEVKEPLETPGGPAHFGIQVKTPEKVSEAVTRLSAAGLVDQIEEETACCYAVQDKVWAVDPDGNRWEVFVVLDPDSDQYQDSSSSCCATAETKSEAVACCRVGAAGDQIRMPSENPSTEQVWELLSARLRSFLLARVSDPHIAEDLLQETFLRIHQKLDSVRESERLSAWVFQIARNLVTDHYRDQGKRESASLQEEDQFPGEDSDNTINELVMSWFPGMIDRLPEKYREAIFLYEIEGISQQEIANRLNLSLSGAKSRVQRGRELLKTILFDCCSFEKDRRGNVIAFEEKGADCCQSCED